MAGTLGRARDAQRRHGVGMARRAAVAWGRCGEKNDISYLETHQWKNEKHLFFSGHWSILMGKMILYPEK